MRCAIHVTGAMADSAHQPASGIESASWGMKTSTWSRLALCVEGRRSGEVAATVGDPHRGSVCPTGGRDCGSVSAIVCERGVDVLGIQRYNMEAPSGIDRPSSFKQLKIEMPCWTKGHVPKSCSSSQLVLRSQMLSSLSPIRRRRRSNAGDRSFSSTVAGPCAGESRCCSDSLRRTVGSWSSHLTHGTSPPQQECWDTSSQ